MKPRAPKWHRIYLQLLGDPHPCMWGVISHRELIAARMIDGVRGEITWRRRSFERCDEFEERIIENIRQLMDAEQAPLVAQGAK